MFQLKVFKVIQQNVSCSKLVGHVRRASSYTFNSVQLLGNAGMDGRNISKTENPVVHLSLATHRWTRLESGEIEQTSPEWHNIIVALPGLTNIAINVKKGDRIFLRGRLTYRDFTSPEGHQYSRATILADTLSIVQRKHSPGESSKLNEEDTN